MNYSDVTKLDQQHTTSIMQNISTAYPNTQFHPDKLPAATIACYQAFMIITMVLGIPGNILVILVNARMVRKSPMDLIITYMSICDLIPLLIAVPLRLSDSTKFWYVIGSDWLCKLRLYIGQVTTWSSALTLGVMAIERYLRVCRNKATIQTQWAAIKRCLIVTLVTVVISIPNGMAHGNNQAGKCGVTTTSNRKLMYAYFIGLALTMILLSAVILSLYCLIAKKVWKHSKIFKTSTSMATSKAYSSTKISSPKKSVDQNASKPAWLRSNKVADISGKNTLTQKDQNSDFKRLSTERMGTRSESISAEVQSQTDEPKAKTDKRGKVSKTMNASVSLKVTDRNEANIQQNATNETNFHRNTVTTDISCNTISIEGNFYSNPNSPGSDMNIQNLSQNDNGVMIQVDAEKTQHKPIIPVPIIVKITEDENKKKIHYNNRTQDETQAIQSLSIGPEKLNKKNKAMSLKTTKILFSVSLVFILSWIPPWIAFALSVINGTKITPTLYQANIFMLRANFLSMFMNPILYYFMNIRFKEQVWQIFRSIKRKLRCGNQTFRITG